MSDSPENNQQQTNEPKSFLETLPEELRANPSLQKFTKAEDVAKSYVEMQALLGNKVTKPGKDATPEQIAEFYGALIPEKYELNFEDLGVMTKDEILNQNLLDTFKKEGFTNRQAQSVLDQVRGLLASKETAVLTARERAEQERKAAFDSQFGSNLESNRELVDQYLKKQFGDDIAEQIKKSDAYNDASSFGELLKKARAAAPDPGVKKDTAPGTFDNKANLEQAREQMLNGSHPVFGRAVLDPFSPKHVEAQKEFAKIQEALQTY